jgi:hypothetical protein
MNQFRGLFRTAIQSVTATVLAWGPVQWLIGVAGWEITSDNVEAMLWPVVMSVFYGLFDWLQQQPWVAANPVLRFVIGTAMGGGPRPSYEGQSDG